MRLLVNTELTPLSQTRAFINSTEALFNKSSAGALNSGHAGVERRSDLLICKTLVSFDQDACPHYFARWMFTTPDELKQVFALIGS